MGARRVNGCVILAVEDKAVVYLVVSKVRAAHELAIHSAGKRLRSSRKSDYPDDCRERNSALEDVGRGWSHMAAHNATAVIDAIEIREGGAGIVINRVLAVFPDEPVEMVSVLVVERTHNDDMMVST